MSVLPLDGISDLIKSVLVRVWPDPAQQADAQLKLATLAQTGELAEMVNGANLALAQIGVNNTEAAGTGFKSNWRPFVGWICGTALGWNFVLRPAIECGMALAGNPLKLPLADIAPLMPILFGMLGLGSVLRTVEKVKGVA